MKARKMGSKLMAMLMAVVMVLGLSLTAVAASTTTTIDPDAEGSLTLYKYDYSAAKAAAEANSVTLAEYEATGEKNTEAETTYGGYAIAGVTFTALKVADIQTYETGSSAEVVYSLDTTLASDIGLDTASAVTSSGTTYYWTSTQISDALEKKLESDENSKVTTTTDTLKSYVATSGTSVTTDTSGMASWSELAVGLYLVVETSVPDQVYSTTDPFFVSIPMTSSDGTGWNYDVVAYPKNQTDYPDIAKKVRESSNSTGAYTDTVSTSINDSLDYRIVSELPSITSEATYLTKYTFVDTLSAGQDYTSGSLAVSFYSSITDKTASTLDETGVTKTDLTAAVDENDTNGDYLVTTVTDTSTKVTTITISLTATGLAKVNAGAAKSTDSNGDYSFIVISYTATLNANAVLGDEGNDNDVVLTYSRTNTSYSETLEDKTEVYTFGLDITKAFSDGSTDKASEVQFTLTNTTTGAYITGTASEDGKYTVTGTATTTASDNNTVFSPASGGKLYIAGLEAGTYTLTEIKTASGYNLLKNSIEIVINSKAEKITASTVGYKSNNSGNTVTTASNVSETDTATTSATVNSVTATMTADATVSTSSNAAVQIEITNTKGFSLPMTGGEGVWILTILGVLIIGLGAYSLVLRKVKRA